MEHAHRREALLPVGPRPSTEIGLEVIEHQRKLVEDEDMTHARKWNMRLDKIAKNRSKFQNIKQAKYRAALLHRPTKLGGREIPSLRRNGELDGMQWASPYPCRTNRLKHATCWNLITSTFNRCDSFPTSPSQCNLLSATNYLLRVQAYFPSQ